MHPEFAVSRPARVRNQFIARVAGLSTHATLSMRSDVQAALLSNIADVKTLLRSLGSQLSAELHPLIGASLDAERRRHLLSLRRSLFRGELPPLSSLQSARLLPIEIRMRVEQATALIRHQQGLLESFEASYTTEMLQSREHFRARLADADFQKALQLSSKSLSLNLQRYLRADLRKLGSRNEQIERGLLRYLTRASMKATPFGRFCTVIGGSLETTPMRVPTIPEALIVIDGALSPKFGFVRLNKAVFSKIWAQLRTMEPVRELLTVVRNPTLVEETAHLVFLTSQNGLETFHRISKTASVMEVLALIQREAEPTLGNLSHSIATHDDFDVTQVEAYDYLSKLEAIGLVRFQSFVPDQEAAWDVVLSHALMSVNDARIQSLISSLREIRSRLNQYSDASMSARDSITGHISEAFSNIFSVFGIQAQLPHDLLFYEDATAAARAVIERTPALERALSSLNDWVRLTTPLAFHAIERASMRHFFDGFYPDGGQVSLLRFYEDYYREHFRTHLEKERRIAAGESSPELEHYDLANPFSLAFIRSVRDARVRLSELLRKSWQDARDARVVNISRVAVDNAVADLGEVTRCSASSTSVFCQFAVESVDGRAEVSVVVPQGQYFVGFGKYFSRFLYMLPPSFQGRVLQDNGELCSQALLAEIAGDAGFNANLHPQLLPYEIPYPTADSASHQQQIPSGAIVVAKDADHPNSLCLIDSVTGRRVLPIDLGFLNPQLRPPLYQLLSRFSPSGGFAAPLSVGPRLAPGSLRETHKHESRRAEFSDSNLRAHGSESSSSEAMHRPRIVFDDHLVLARESWIVDGADIPRFGKGESRTAYWLRADDWRRRNGIPDRIYMKLLPPSRAASQRAIEHSDELQLQFVHDSEQLSDRAAADMDVVTAGGSTGTGVTNASGVKPAESAERQLRAKASRDWQKPQFIDFANPLLIDLFGRFTGPAGAFSILIEECFPDATSLPQCGGEAFTYELVLHCDQRSSFEERSGIDEIDLPIGS